ncbi:MAG: RodZ domain-containing protein [Thermodesulfobacteriota bacterium]
MDEKNDIPAAESASPPQETVPNLKALREASGLSLPDIFETTRVGLIYLAAVESGEFNRLPPPVYARNFIWEYARTVGVDEKPILNRYEKYLESLKPTVKETEIQKPWPETGGRNRFLFASLAAVIIAGALVSALFLYDRAGKPASPPPVADSPSPAPVMPEPAPTAAVPAASAQATTAGSVTASPGAAIPSPAAAGKMYHLVIEARELTWIRITEDRNPAYQALLKPGDKIERMASDYFQLDIGNAGGINLTFQGKSLGSLGKPGQIIHMRLPEKGSDRKTP